MEWPRELWGCQAQKRVTKGNNFSREQHSTAYSRESANRLQSPYLSHFQGNFRFFKMVRDTGFEPVTPTVSRVGSKEDCHTRNVTPPKARFINPHRLFHGVWLPHWLEERPEISEKSKKLYAYLTYFAGGKGYAWPSFNHLAEKLHVSRRYVITLVQELSAHQLIAVTHVSNPAKGHCTNH
jgi:sarcosine oxidase delta subunit